MPMPMLDAQNATPPAEDSTEGTPVDATDTDTTEPDEGAPEADVESTEADVEVDERDAELPDWARERLTKANGQAASYRVQLRDAEARVATLEAQLTSVKTLEEFDAVMEDFAKSKAENAALIRENVAKEFNLPAELAEVLAGESRDDLVAHAKRLAKFAPASGDESDLHGGLEPKMPPVSEGTPRDLVNKYRRRR